MGDLHVWYRTQDGPWIKVVTASLPTVSTVSTGSPTEHLCVQQVIADGRPLLEIRQRYSWDNDTLDWRLELENRSAFSVEIGGLGLILPFATDFVGKSGEETYTKRVISHRFISGHGSFLYWTRANGAGANLVMIPQGDTQLEYFDEECVAYMHSIAPAQAVKDGTWRQPLTSRVLAIGDSNKVATYQFKLRWAEDLEGIRQILCDEGSFDTEVSPGMVVPRDLAALVSFRTHHQVESLEAEHPDETMVEEYEIPGETRKYYRLRFSRLGENLLTVRYASGRMLRLEFFVTEPLETLVKKRAAFIVAQQQHRNPQLWYDGLFSLWDMRARALRGPDSLGGLAAFMVGGSDDPCTGKPVYLSEKNVVYPDSREIGALEYFVKHFVWGKHQRTDKETPYPYGIYGSDNWYLNRTTPTGMQGQPRDEAIERRLGGYRGTGLGQERMWRTFDYTHYFALYFNLYRIAKQNPELVHYLDAAGYLERAFRTAQAYFEVPYSIYMPGPPLWTHKGYSDWAYKQGNFHERYLIPLMAALRDEGRPDAAESLRREWEKKVKYMLYDDPYPYGSEMAFDRTAFESTHAVARYALENPLQPDENLWQDKNTGKWYSHPKVSPDDAADFMKRQIAANISIRGCIEPAYYYLGSATVGNDTLDYMSQMGGWSILDHALYARENASRYARLGYAALLSSWCLLNSGTAESNYGYWFPGPENDGAAGWNFKTSKFGETWMGMPTTRGAWFVDGEIDHGFLGAVAAACTVVIDDPIFRLIALGGEVQLFTDKMEILPRDGVRQRIYVRASHQRIDLHLDRDGFHPDSPVKIRTDCQGLEFALESRSTMPHQTTLSIQGLVPGRYYLMCAGDRREFDVESAAKPCTVTLAVDGAGTRVIRLHRLNQEASGRVATDTRTPAHVQEM